MKKILFFIFVSLLSHGQTNPFVSWSASNSAGTFNGSAYNATKVSSVGNVTKGGNLCWENACCAPYPNNMLVATVQAGAPCSSTDYLTNTYPSTVDPSTMPYMEFSFNVNGTQTINWDKFVIDGIDPGTRVKLDVRSSLDNYATSLGWIQVLEDGFSNYYWGATDISELNTNYSVVSGQIKFRIYPYNNTYGNGSIGFNDYANVFTQLGNSEGVSYSAATYHLSTNKAVSIWASATSVVPTITTTGSLSTFTTCIGNASTPQSFSVSGTNMAAGISIAALTGFEYSLTSNGTYTSTLTVGGSGTIASTPVYVRLQSSPNDAGYAAANIVLSSSGATSKNISASGNVTSAPQMLLLGTSINLDGVNDYLYGPSSTSLSLEGSTSITLEAWVNPTVFSSAHFAGPIMYKGGGGESYRLGVGGSGRVGLTVANQWSNHTLETADNAVALNTWQHIAATYDGTTKILKIYINGVQVATNTNTQSFNLNGSYGTFNIGRDPYNSNRWFNGSIDEARVWNITRSASEIATNFNNQVSSSSTGLMAYYRFNQGIGGGDNTSITSIYDNSVNDNTLTVSGLAMNGTTSNLIENGASISGPINNAASGSSYVFSYSGAYTNGSWSTSNSSVATINSSGILTVVSNGSLDIIYSFDLNGCSYQATHTVNASIPIPTITLSGTLNAFTKCN
ncbi:MAG: hypothetical protein NWQ14_06750, partial [Flavobacterium sp.]|nr:hypothetical protein [Flavobacterium sp.]